jgi:hypothetical protein
VTAIKYRNAIAQIAHDTHIVSDEDHRDAGLRLQVFKQLYILPLGGDVQRRRGFVCDE